MPIFELGKAIPVKSHVGKFGLDWLSLSRVIVSTNIFLGGRNPLLGGGRLHLTCDAHFRTRMSYSSQKTCVKIFLGLVEIGGMLILRGVENRLLWGLHVTCDAHFRTCPFFLDKSHEWKFGSDWLRLSRVIVGTKKKKKKNTDGAQFNILTEFSFRANNNNNNDDDNYNKR